MAERRPLISGLKPQVEVDQNLEKQFVHGEKATLGPPDKALTKPPVPEPRDGKGQASITRVPFTTRVRTDFAAALKRASLERQLEARFPNTLQDILEEALEPWLRANGYIK